MTTYIQQAGCKVVENEIIDALLALSDGKTEKAREKLERAIGRTAAIRRELRELDEWRDAEDERYSDEAHEPKERT